MIIRTFHRHFVCHQENKKGLAPFSTIFDALPQTMVQPPHDTGKKKLTLQDIAYPKRNPNVLLDFRSDVIKVERTFDGGIVNVRLNRPQKGNAFDMDMWIDFKKVFDMINSDENSKVVVLAGEGKSFSTGMDLSVFASMQSISAAESCEGRKRECLSHIIQYLQDSISAPEHCEVPVICAISGYCTGGAVDLVTACDLRYCTEDAEFSIKETDLAMVADIGTLQRVPKLIGDMQARELAYTGRKLSGREAEKMGLVLKCFSSHDDMMKEVFSVAKSIAEKSPLSIRGIKKTILYSRDHSVDDSLNQVKLWNAAHMYSDDLKAAMQALFQKSKPKYEKK